MLRYPLLEQLFAQHPSKYSYARFEQDDSDGAARQMGETLLAAAAQAQVRGLAKLTRIGSPGKFLNLLAELRFALFFRALGADVEILEDEAFGSRVATPDLLVTMPNGARLLLEVTRWSSGHADIGTPFDAALKTAQLRVRVEVFRGPGMSSPSIWGDDRRAARDVVSALVEEAIAALSALNVQGVTNGGVHILHAQGALRTVQFTKGMELRELLHAPPSTGDDWLATFGFSQLHPDEEGHYAGGMTSVHTLDDEGYKGKVLLDLERKAAGRAKLPPEFAATPYIVAVQNDEHECLPRTMLSAITGARCRDRFSSRRTELPSEIAALADTPWFPLLKEWRYLDSPSTWLEEFGAYHRLPWARDLSGVLAFHTSHRVLQWLPNPLASPSDAGLLKLGLPIAALGAEIAGQCAG